MPLPLARLVDEDFQPRDGERRLSDGEDSKSEEQLSGSKYAQRPSTETFFGKNLQHRNDALFQADNSLKAKKQAQRSQADYKLSGDEEDFEDDTVLGDSSVKSTTVYSRFDEKDKEEEQKTKFEDFRVIHPIGKGTFGKVYLVHCAKDHSFYAMKSIRKDMIIDHDSIANLKLEKQILLQANHKFIVGMDFIF